ncbi:unnamed protein product, partial [Gulo gulo]
AFSKYQTLLFRCVLCVWLTAPFYSRGKKLRLKEKKVLTQDLSHLVADS